MRESRQNTLDDCKIRKICLNMYDGNGGCGGDSTNDDDDNFEHISAEHDVSVTVW